MQKIHTVVAGLLLLLTWDVTGGAEGAPRVSTAFQYASATSDESADQQASPRAAPDDSQTTDNDQAADPEAEVQGPSSTGTPPARSTVASSFDQGAADRKSWEDWFASKSGDFHAGAAFWAASRSLRDHGPCKSAANQIESAEWIAGCVAAQRELAAFDRLRKRSRAYRQGWNSVPALPEQAPATQTNAPSAPTDSGIGAGTVLLILFGLGFIFVLARQGGAKAGKPGAQRPANPSSAPVRRSAPAARVVTSNTGDRAPQFSWRAPSADDLRKESLATWKQAGDAVVVQGVSITRGLIYVGDNLRRRDGPGAPENCLINPNLPAAPATVGDPSRHLHYWPDYAHLPPETRYAYLLWLGGDRTEPDTNIGYVFLYFYGLERRLMLDPVADDREVIIAEVERLQGIYGHNPSFRLYSTKLLQAARPQAGGVVESEPSFEKEGYELPLSLRMALGRFAAARQPIPADWVLSWVMCDPQLYVRTPATRDFETFKELFARRWAATKQSAIVFTDAQIARFPRLKIDYRAASNTFNVTLAIGGDLPDVQGAKQVINRAHEVALKCCDELSDYSRLIGRRPELVASIAASALLPPDSSGWQTARDAMAQAASSGKASTTAEIVALIDRSARPDAVSPSQWRKAGEALAKLGFGVVPDPDLSFARVTSHTPALVYALPTGSNDVPDAMSAVALVVQIGALVAAADGVVSPEERDQLKHAAALGELDARQNARLAAQADWLLSTDTKPAELKSRLAKVSADTRTLIVDLALDVARRDGRIVAAEVKQLEQVFAWLGLPNSILYSALHGDGPVEVSAAATPPPGVSITAPLKPRRLLDKDRIAAIARDSAKSSALLQAVFGDEEDEVAQPEPVAPLHRDPIFAGLSDSLAAFGHAVCEQETWSRADLSALAASHDTMLDGAIERLNDWALDRWDELLIEDGDTIHINHSLLALSMEA
jgi:tellurite resistance protein